VIDRLEYLLADQKKWPVSEGFFPYDFSFAEFGNWALQVIQEKENLLRRKKIDQGKLPQDSICRIVSPKVLVGGKRRLLSYDISESVLMHPASLDPYVRFSENELVEFYSEARYCWIRARVTKVLRTLHSCRMSKRKFLKR